MPISRENYSRSSITTLGSFSKYSTYSLNESTFLFRSSMLSSLLFFISKFTIRKPETIEVIDPIP